MTSWAPLKVEDDLSSPWILELFKMLARDAPYGNSRVYMGFGYDNLWVGAEAMQAYYGQLRSAPAAKLITSHALAGPGFGGDARPSQLQLLDQAGLLGKDILLSHAPHMSDADAARLHETGAFVSSTPNTELQMGMPAISLQPAVRPQGSIGVDCHSWGASYMPTQMSLLLQQQRQADSLALAGEGKWSRHVSSSVEQAFNLGTVGGARAAGVADEVGRLAVGMKADVVVFDGMSPGMLAAAQEDPVAAVVLHSSIRDVDMVIIDGVVRKEGGKLLDVTVAESLRGLKEEPAMPAGKKLAWTEIAAEILNGRERLNEQVKGIDFEAAANVVITNFFMDHSKLVD